MMKSKIAECMSLVGEPVAIVWPEDAPKGKVAAFVVILANHTNPERKNVGSSFLHRETWQSLR